MNLKNLSFYDWADLKSDNDPEGQALQEILEILDLEIGYECAAFLNKEYLQAQMDRNKDSFGKDSEGKSLRKSFVEVYKKVKALPEGSIIGFEISCLNLE